MGGRRWAMRVQQGEAVRGRPVQLKCPKCMVGKWGYPPVLLGFHRTGETKEKKSRLGLAIQERIECRDCGHSCTSLPSTSRGDHFVYIRAADSKDALDETRPVP